MTDFAKLVSRGSDRESLSADETARIGKKDKTLWLVVWVALSLSVGALWYTMSVVERLGTVERQLSQLSLTVTAAPSREGGESLRNQLRDLGARVNNLAVIIEGPLSHLRQSNEESLGALTQRLVQLEQKVAARAEASLTVADPMSQNSETPSPTTMAATGWVINLLSLSSEKDAREQLLRLLKAGVRAQMQQAEHDGKRWYRLRVPGFSSYEGAKAYIETVEKQAGVKNAWVAKE